MKCWIINEACRIRPDVEGGGLLEIGGGCCRGCVVLRSRPEETEKNLEEAGIIITEEPTISETDQGAISKKSKLIIESLEFFYQAIEKQTAFFQERVRENDRIIFLDGFLIRLGKKSEDAKNPYTKESLRIVISALEEEMEAIEKQIKEEVLTVRGGDDKISEIRDILLVFNHL